MLSEHFKKLYRIYDKENGKAMADLITVYDEIINEDEPLTLFDPEHTWKRKTVTNYKAIELQKPVFLKGKCVYPRYTTDEIRDYCAAQLELQWDEVKRFENPHKYYVDLSQKLWDTKHKLLAKYNSTKDACCQHFF